MTAPKTAPEPLLDRNELQSLTPTQWESKVVILLVEDEEVLRSQVAEMLESLGHTVEAVGTSEDAMLVLQRSAIDVLVADVGLPGTSGDVFAAEARAIQPRLRVVFATGRSLGAPNDPGGPVLLMKPFGLQELEAALRIA
jgi:DNA-binding response OmpR family regulator